MAQCLVAGGTAVADKGGAPCKSNAEQEAGQWRNGGIRSLECGHESDYVANVHCTPDVAWRGHLRPLRTGAIAHVDCARYRYHVCFEAAQHKPNRL